MRNKAYGVDRASEIQGMVRVFDQGLGVIFNNVVTQTTSFAVVILSIAKFHDHVEQPSLYARSLIQYCCYKALNVTTKRPDHLTHDMMLSCEVPDDKPDEVTSIGLLSACSHEDYLMSGAATSTH